ncbi:MAG: hypothetical protein ACF8QF_07670 [Phycisphaerales bacterium]
MSHNQAIRVSGVKRLLAAVLAFGLIGTGALLLFLNAPRQLDGPSARGLALSQQASERFNKAERIDTLAPISEIASRFFATPTVGPPPENEAAQEAFARWLATFFKARAEGTASAYATWAEANGLVRATIDTDPEWTRMHYEGCTGKSLPADTTLGSLFEVFFNCYLEQRKGADLPVAVGTGADGAKIWFARIRFGEHVPPMPLQLLEDSASWLGSRSVNNRQVWLPRTPLSQVIERDGTALVARAFVGTRSRSGTWYTTMVAAFYDPVAEHWILDRLAVQNTHDSSIGAPPF